MWYVTPPPTREKSQPNIDPSPALIGFSAAAYTLAVMTQVDSGKGNEPIRFGMRRSHDLPRQEHHE
jgi:hypothetical protein